MKGEKVASRLRHHIQPIPVCPQETESPRTHAIYRQDIKSPVPIQGVICLLKVQEYGTEDLLPHGCHLLERLNLEGGGTLPSSRSEIMQGFMVVDCRGQPPVNDNSGGLPHDIHYPNYSDALSIYLGNQHHRLSCAGLRKGPLLKRCLHQCDHISSVGVVRILLLRRLPEALVEMLRLHARWSSQAVQSEMFDQFCNLRLLGDGIVYGEGGDPLLKFYLE